MIDFFGPDAWINGGSPTDGAILFGAKGPFADLYANLAGHGSSGYMLSMLLIGTALILGVATWLAAIGGIIWMGSSTRSRRSGRSTTRSSTSTSCTRSRSW